MIAANSDVRLHWIITNLSILFSADGALELWENAVPSISVGIPAFNNGETLDRAVRSVLSQTYSDWTLVISDDGSDDESRVIARSFANADPRISFIEQPRNLGFMNFGAILRHADAPYFAWLAGDDYWGPDFLATTSAALEADPAAVSAIPGCTFGDDKADPDTSALSGPDRRQRFLAAPNGSRMYGLFRTDVLRRAFPSRAMYAYDFYLMLGVLRHGAQLSVQGTHLFRERTPWRTYAKMADSVYSNPILRRYPLLDMSFWAVLTGRIPLRRKSLRTLLHINRCKHEEYLFVTDPAKFAAEMSRAQRLGLPMSSDPATYISRAKELLPDGSGLAILEAATKLGDAEAAIVAAQHFLDQNEPLAAREWLQKSAELGHPDTVAHLIQLEHEPGAPFTSDQAEKLIAAVHGGSSAALSLFARDPTSIPVEHRTDAFNAVQHAAGDASGNALRALAAFKEFGIGTQVDIPGALDAFTNAAEGNPWIWRDAARVAEKSDNDALFRAYLEKAALAGSGWSARDLADLHDDEEGRTKWLAKAAATEEAQRDAALKTSLEKAFDAVPEAACLAEATHWLVKITSGPQYQDKAEVETTRQELAALGFCPHGHSFTGKRLLRLITESVA